MNNIEDDKKKLEEASRNYFSNKNTIYIIAILVLAASVLFFGFWILLWVGPLVFFFLFFCSSASSSKDYEEKYKRYHVKNEFSKKFKNVKYNVAGLTDKNLVLNTGLIIQYNEFFTSDLVEAENDRFKFTLFNVRITVKKSTYTEKTDVRGFHNIIYGSWIVIDLPYNNDAEIQLFGQYVRKNYTSIAYNNYNPVKTGNDEFDKYFTTLVKDSNNFKNTVNDKLINSFLRLMNTFKCDLMIYIKDNKIHIGFDNSYLYFNSCDLSNDKSFEENKAIINDVNMVSLILNLFDNK